MTFEIESMVRGYHVYNETWEAVIGEQLTCERDTTNHHDRFAVAVMKLDAIVGHLPKRISSVCSLFLRRGGSIRCVIIGNRRYSKDLPQGGLELPSMLTFEGNKHNNTENRKANKGCFGFNL